MDRYQISANGKLHRYPNDHGGSSAPLAASLVSKDRYDLCDHPRCFGRKASVTGALKPNAEPQRSSQRVPRRRRSTGVRTTE